MLNFLIDNLASIIVGTIVLLIVSAVLIKLISDKKITKAHAEPAVQAAPWLETAINETRGTVFNLLL
jgi:hypothetical protein